MDAAASEIYRLDIAAHCQSVARHLSSMERCTARKHAADKRKSHPDHLPRLSALRPSGFGCICGKSSACTELYLPGLPRCCT
ncbi:MAG: hypothetical protein RJA63_3 [Pseudomonadota bacterium]|jgi:hypothetical protein